MNKYHFIFLIWLLPLYFLFQGGYQVLAYYGVQSTFNTGESYVASVTDFDVKQIAAQTNGYVVLNFTTAEGVTIERQLGLPVQFAQVIMESEVIPIRYSENSFRPIVMMPVYELQRNVIRVNIAVTSFGFLATLIVAWYSSKFARRRIREGEETLEIEVMEEEEEEEETTR